MRCHKDPTQKTTRAQKTPTTPTAATSAGALHPIRGTTPDKGHCTRTEKVHCLRIGCSAPTHKNKRGTDRTHLRSATTSPGASGGLIVPHGHCLTASVVQVARSDSCCALLILTPTATPQEPKPDSNAEDDRTRHQASRLPHPAVSPRTATPRQQARGQPHPGSKPAARRDRAPRLLAGTTRPPRCTPWQPSAHTRSQ